MKEIIKSIKEGFWNAYVEYDTFRPPDSDFPNKITEYLFTVNVARKLDKHYPRKGSCGIFLEYPYLQFINLARAEQIYGEKKDILKNITTDEFARFGVKERIDIVFQGKSIGQQFPGKEDNFAIEIKGINPSFSEIRSDIERLMYSLLTKNKKGHNYISGAYCVFLKRLDSDKKIYDKTFKNVQFKKYEKKLNDQLEILFKGTGLKYAWSPFSFYSISQKEYIEGYPSEDLSEEGAMRKTGILIGIIISISKN